MTYNYDRRPAARVAASDDPAERVQELKDLLRRARRMKGMEQVVAELSRLLEKAEEAAKANKR